MGGEQYSVLMYGPKVEYNIDELIYKFNLINKKEWVKNFMLNEKHDYEEPYDSDDEQGVNIVFEQEFKKHQFFDLLSKFLNKYSLNFVFNNNLCWDHVLIGIKVKDYNLFSDNEKQKVKDFCNKYYLPEPTFYAGIDGEFE
jgi:hypothetical protein